MNMRKTVSISRGITAVASSLLAIATLGYSIADTYRGALDDAFGTQSYVISVDENDVRYKADYDSIDGMIAAAKAHAIKQGEEGTVLLKNDNGVLPFAEKGKLALFGLSAYAPYPLTSGDFKAGNSDAIDLLGALETAGFAVNTTVKDMYVKVINKHTEEGKHPWTGAPVVNTVYDLAPNASVGDLTDFKINEPTVDYVANRAAVSDWKSSITKSDTVGVCVFSRPAGESNTFKPGSAVDFNGNKTGKDPLALSDDELAVVQAAKDSCSKVLVLLNTGNVMEIGAIAKGGSHEVDGIAYIGIPNDYQFTGIVNVLAGKVNATGALASTFVYHNTSSPAMQNFGGDYYTDYQSVSANAVNGFDSRYPNVEIGNFKQTSSFGGGPATYNGGSYIVEAEGIYVGYKYYETRYYDSVANPSYQANSTKGSSNGGAWSYANEVTYPFGYGLSYLSYEQTVRSVSVDKTVDGNVTATVAVTNKSGKEGKFLAQLYVQQPYTEYDRKNGVEKSAVTFLNSKKVTLKAGETQEVEISVPAKYLASYDYQTAKTYILDGGDYLFTAANGAHEATNNFLSYKGYTGDAVGKGAVVKWSLAELDKTTYATDNGKAITNVADDADLNYWIKDKVTYLSRQNWDATYPVNYNQDVTVALSESPKKAEWISQLRGNQYAIKTDGAEVENVNGKDTGVKFSTQYIGYEQLVNVNDAFWSVLVSGISADQAVGAVIHGGSQSDVLTNVDNPIVVQNEGVCGFTAKYTEEGSDKTYQFNVNSQTLLGSSFNPELAWEWGVIMGNSGLFLKRYNIWGTGLTQIRTPYNGRNYEYISEDAMLTNRMGYGVMGGAKTKGIIVGPKHIGFNDQEHNRNGVSVYLNEQKFRETDLRCFQGGIEDADGLAVMVAFNRIGAVNASHHVGMLKTILREEWGFTGIISTDMMNNKYYFNPEACVMATCTQIADFAKNDNTISAANGRDNTWEYLSVEGVRRDATLVNQARENLKYQLYTFANSAVVNVSTVPVTPWWEGLIRGVIIGSAIVTGLAAAVWLVSSFLPERERKQEVE